MYRDLLKARDRGEDDYKIHAEKLENGLGVPEPIKKAKLKTFNYEGHKQ